MLGEVREDALDRRAEVVRDVDVREAHRGAARYPGARAGAPLRSRATVNLAGRTSRSVLGSVGTTDYRSFTHRHPQGGGRIGEHVPGDSWAVAPGVRATLQVCDLTPPSPDAHGRRPAPTLFSRARTEVGGRVQTPVLSGATPVSAPGGGSVHGSEAGTLTAPRTKRALRGRPGCTTKRRVQRLCSPVRPRPSLGKGAQMTTQLASTQPSRPAPAARIPAAERHALAVRQSLRWAERAARERDYERASHGWPWSNASTARCRRSGAAGARMGRGVAGADRTRTAPAPRRPALSCRSEGRRRAAQPAAVSRSGSSRRP